MGNLRYVYYIKRYDDANTQVTATLQSNAKLNIRQIQLYTFCGDSEISVNRMIPGMNVPDFIQNDSILSSLNDAEEGDSVLISNLSKYVHRHGNGWVDATGATV